MAKGVMIDLRGAGPRLASERRRDPTLADYLDSAAKLRLDLTFEQERKMAARIEAGDMRARSRFIEGQLLLVAKIAACYSGQGVPIIDIIGYGNIGLCIAVDRFRPLRARFSTFAGWRIRAACVRSMVDTGTVIRLPHNVAAARQRLYKLDTRALADVGAELSDDAAAHALDLSPAAVARIRAAQDSTLSLDMPLSPGNRSADDGAAFERELTLGGTIPDDTQVIEDAVTLSLDSPRVRQALTRAMACLTARERSIITLRYGSGSKRPRTLDSVGASLGIKHEAVRLGELRALATLRRIMQEELGVDARDIASALFGRSA